MMRKELQNVVQLLNCYLRAAELEMRAAEQPLEANLDVAGLKEQVLERLEEAEQVDEQLYWFLAPGERDAFGELPATGVALSIPWWPEAVKSAHGMENGRVYAPMVFTAREGAEAKLREFEASEAEAFLGLAEEHGEADVNEALDNTLPTQVYEISKDTLVSKLEDSDFLCVAVDGRLMLRQDFVEELRKQPEKRGEE